MTSEFIALFLAVGYIVASLMATIFVRRRGFSGMRLVLLVMLVWLVPFLGAGCASAAAWERGRFVGGSDPIPNEWLAASTSQSVGANDGAGGSQ